MRSRLVPHGLPGVVAAVLWTRCFVAGPAAAAVPSIELWTMDGRYVKTALDRIETNQAYAVDRRLETSCRIVNPPGDGPVQVEDLVLRCVFPAGVAFRFTESGADRGVWFYQWDAAQTSLVARLAGVLTNDTPVRVSPELTTSNAWVWPRVSVSRACDPIQIPALGAVTQTCTVVVMVPPSSLAGLTNLEVSLPAWNLPTEKVEVSMVANSFPPQFSEFPSGPLRGYVAADAASLAGTYTFVNTLLVSNKTSQALQFVPEVETRYEERFATETTGVQTALRQEYGNGMAVVASTPGPATWQSTWTRGLTSLALLAKCVAVGAPPLLTDIRMVRATTVSANGLIHADLMVSCDGSNLLAGVVTTPGNRRLDMEVEGGTSLYFEPASCNATELAEFTNGTYRVDLLDATNGTAATYAFALRGASVTQVPVLLTPPGLSAPDPRPMFSWSRATNANASAVLLMLNNAWLSSESFNLWPGTSVTNHTPDSDFYASVAWSLVFGDLLMTNSGATSLMSGYATFREGLFNVVSNGFNLASVHLAAGPLSALAGDAVALSVPNYGFFTGGAMTFHLLFGDGEDSFGASAAHTYATSGVYTARVIATDGTGAAATGSVTVTVHPVPLFSSAGRAAAGKIALSFPTVSGAVYRAQFADSLRIPSWGPLAMVTSGTGGTMSVHTSGSLTQRFYRLTCQLPGTAAPGAFEPLAFPIRNTGDVVRMAAFGIPDWSGTDPHNGIDLQISGALASSEIVSPATGTVTGIRIDTNEFSNPPGQLLLDVTILSPDALEVHLVLEPSSVDPTLKANQIAAVHVTEGQEVGVGTPVADLLVGTLGYPHLHYMLMRGGEFVCAYGYSSPEAQAAFEAIAAGPTNNLPDGNISYGEP